MSVGLQTVLIIPRTVYTTVDNLIILHMVVMIFGYDYTQRKKIKMVFRNQNA